VVIEYAKDHWRGKHHIAWSLFINGLLPYAVILAVAIAASIFLPGFFLSGFRHDPGLWLFALMWISWLLWFAVGTTRSAFRTLREPLSGITPKVLSIAALLLLAIGFVLLMSDMQIVARWLRGA
jgi:hypothetical protein